MTGIEQLKRRMTALAPAPGKDYPKSAWERMTPGEKRADCRKWIEVWLKYNGETLTEEEMEGTITRCIQDAETFKENREERIRFAQLPDAEINRLAGQIIKPGAGTHANE
jgi:hypothetical protein